MVEQEQSTKRPLVGLVGAFVLYASILLAMFHLYTGGFGMLSEMVQRSIHWFGMSMLALLLYPGSRRSARKPSILDWTLVAASLAATLYIVSTWEGRLMRVSGITTAEVVLGVMMIVVVLEASRRTTGLALTVTALAALLYAHYGPYLPGFLGHRGYPLSRIASFLFVSTEGIYGTPIGISASFIVLFVLFGGFLNALGGGKFFIDISYALVGRFRGGPAKTAVVSSALMGTVSGSPVANVVTTGTFTIPLMKETGYPPYVAGAVEAVASTGGMLAPPIMGSAAFIMADYLQIPYARIALAAAIPAVLYYFSLYRMVDLEALKAGLSGLPSSKLPDIRATIVSGGHLIIPLAVLVALLIWGWSPGKMVFWSIILLMVVAALRANTRPTVAKVIQAMKTGVINAVPVATACAAAGIVTGVISMTGLGVKLSSSLIAMAHGSRFLALVYTMIASIILGCGLPAVAVYVLMASLAAPALIRLGIHPIAAHMFVFYFGMISTITPPVALTSYAAAGLAGAPAGRVGWKAFSYGVVAYIVPYMFAYEPCLLFVGTWYEVVIATLTSLVGTYVLAGAVQGYLFGRHNLLERALLFGAACSLIHPGIVTDLVGIAGITAIYIKSRFHRTKLGGVRASEGGNVR